ncbi:unnamed protein product [Adineta steineri]|uniref:G-protein coupled receptors family 1 profile domain-containing protein n=1 Tax=Adineta steineri TaxID=433720 RepID=A0A815TSH4_9BILA|nr:unnamed protein product [Adineta steineri]CAF1504717.1 unnamed protein product [Adineta steineri]
MNDTLQNSLTNHYFSTTPVDILVQKILLGCLLFILSIFTIFGNLLILYAIRTEKRLRTVSNLFILSLAFADLVVGIFVMPLSAANIIAGRWPFSTVLCQMWLSIDYVASTASIFNLVLLSLDRYWAVVYPLRYLRNRSRKRATNFIIIVWFISLLWAPAVIFWSYLIPEHSDIIKPNECDTSFRSNKLFKTLTALGNFYLPLLTMIIISCRIMVAVRSRSTMEFGRRISSATQRQMKQELAFMNTSLIRHENPVRCSEQLSSDGIDKPTGTMSIVVNPLNSEIKNFNIPSCESNEILNQKKKNNDVDDDDDDNDSLGQLESNRSPLNGETRFCFPSIKPITILFPSLSSVRDNVGRKTEQLSQRYSINKSMKNSISVTNDIKYPERQSTIASISLSHIPRALSSSSLSDDCPQTIFIYPLEHELITSTEKTAIRLRTPSSSSSPPVPEENQTTISNDQYLTVPSTLINQPNKMHILTFFDYIINPSLSSSFQKELKAARQLGMLVGVFTITWLPYFILFLVVAWCHNCVSDTIYTASIWLGYINSTVNPLVYPLCNIHFRRAFKKIFYCQHAKTKLPNLNSLRDFRTSHSRHQRE